MPTILELFESSKRNILPNPPSQTPIEKVFKGSTQEKSVKPHTETLIEEELSGIRIHSAVEINNPMLYGNEAIRIMNRSTSLVEIMKDATNGDAAGNGLIGQGLGAITGSKLGLKVFGSKITSISQARDAFNSKLGIPITQIPSRLIGKISEQRSSDIVSRDSLGANGTEVGKFIKKLGGGDPKTLGKQALGAGIGLAKDKLRGALFGSPQTIGEVIGEPIQTTYNNTNIYTQVITDNRDYRKEGGDVADFTGIDLSKVSPTYGVSRVNGKFGRSEYAFQYIQEPNSKKALARWTPDGTYSRYAKDNKKQTLETYRGITNGTDIVSIITAGDNVSIDSNGEFEYNGQKYADLITFYIGKIGENKTMFRSNITGLSETVSPAWNSHKFLGNPFPFYTYSQVERSVSFTLQIYCSSPIELSTNWEKISALTKMTYPAVQNNGLVSPPIIDFKLGDIYHDKYGFIDSLSYSMPDNGTWETEINGLNLPKFIDASITIKLIENVGSAYSLYGFTKSKAAVQSINEERKANEMTSGPQTGITATENPKPLNSRGIVLQETKIPKVNIQKPGSLGSIKGKIGSTLPKENKVGIQTPEQKMSSALLPNTAQSATMDKLKSETAATFMAEQKDLTQRQASALANINMFYANVKQISKSQIPEGYYTTETIDDDALWYSGVWNNGKGPLTYLFINTKTDGLVNGIYGNVFEGETAVKGAKEAGINWDLSKAKKIT